jgi:hypothetical protein
MSLKRLKSGSSRIRSAVFWWNGHRLKQSAYRCPCHCGAGSTYSSRFALTRWWIICSRFNTFVRILALGLRDGLLYSDVMANLMDLVSHQFDLERVRSRDHLEILPVCAIYHSHKKLLDWGPLARTEKVSPSCAQENMTSARFLPVAASVPQSRIVQWVISSFKFQRR